MDSLLPFLSSRALHPLQHAGLSRRSPECRPHTRNLAVTFASLDERIGPLATDKGICAAKSHRLDNSLFPLNHHEC
jgi:hypothetical protein